jgi:adenylate cyclase
VRERTIWRLRIVGGVALLSAAVGAVYGARFAPASVNATLGSLVGAFNGLTLSALETVLQGSAAAALHRLPLVPVLVLRTLVYGVVFRATGMLAVALIGAVAPAALSSGMTMQPSLPFSFGVALAFNFAFMLSGQLGPRVLLALVTGRYRRPRAEERIVLFLDLYGSTGHAERLGDERFHRFLNAVFHDVTDPVLAAGGEIYRYVGDEIIVTWPLARGARNAACIVCCFAISAALARRAAEYRRAFAAEPRLRSALHAGPLVVGEMGDIKREIVMLGDTMNTTARIEEVCRSTGRDMIASEALLRAVGPLPPGVRTEPLGEVALRGKEGDVRLFALVAA